MEERVPRRRLTLETNSIVSIIKDNSPNPNRLDLFSTFNLEYGCTIGPLIVDFDRYLFYVHASMSCAWLSEKSISSRYERCTTNDITARSISDSHLYPWDSFGKRRKTRIDVLPRYDTTLFNDSKTIDMTMCTDTFNPFRRLSYSTEISGEMNNGDVISIKFDLIQNGREETQWSSMKLRNGSMLLSKAVVCQQNVSWRVQKSDKISALPSALSRVFIKNSSVFFPYLSNHIILSYHKQRRSLSCFIIIISRQWNQRESFTCSLSSSVCLIDFARIPLADQWPFSTSPSLLGQYALVHGQDSSTMTVSKWRS